MTQVITRYFDSVEGALAARHELVYRRQFSWRIVHLYDDADGLADTLTAAQVEAATAQAYQDRVAAGGAVLLIEAGYKPLAVATTAREVTAQLGAVDMGDLVQEVEVEDRPVKTLSVLRDHPLMMTRQRDPLKTNFHMADWPIPLISRRKPATHSVFDPPHARMANWPIPLLSTRKPWTKSIFGRHARMANFPIPLLSKRKPFTGSIIGRHQRMANFPIPLISKRKPFTGSVIGRHQRMANWPFPLLINGKTGTNALIPGGPRMANFPIPLISKREPSNTSVFPRHARMANFPIPLISKREPYTGSIFGRHARMADVMLPLVIRRPKNGQHYGSNKFSFSRLLGLPTLISR
jgi:hypothetical protein